MAVIPRHLVDPDMPTIDGTVDSNWLAEMRARPERKKAYAKVVARMRAINAKAMAERGDDG